MVFEECYATHVHTQTRTQLCLNLESFDDVVRLSWRAALKKIR